MTVQHAHRLASIATTATILLLAVATAPASVSAQDMDHSGHDMHAAQQAPDSDAISAAVVRFHEALKAGNADVVREMLVPEARILEGGGIETVEEYASHHLPADMAFAAAVEKERGEFQIFQAADIAWVASTSRSTGTYRDREIDSSGAELMVLRNVDGKWRVAAVHWSSRSR